MHPSTPLRGALLGAFFIRPPAPTAPLASRIRSFVDQYTKLRFPDTKVRFPDTKLRFPDTKLRFPDTKLRFLDTKVRFSEPKIRLKKPEFASK
jgi:hypothetical protein